MEEKYTLNQYQPLLWLAIAEVVALVVSNIIVTKNFMLFGYVASASIVFPILMVATDVISECYGYRISRQVSRGALVVAFAAALIFAAVIALPTASGSEAVQESMITILGQNWMVFMFSSIAFLISSWINDVIFERMKQKGTSTFFSRACISTLVCAVADCLLFFTPLYLVVLGLPVLTALSMLPSVIGYQIVLKAGVEALIAVCLKKPVAKLNIFLGN